MSAVAADERSLDLHHKIWKTPLFAVADLICCDTACQLLGNKQLHDLPLRERRATRFMLIMALLLNIPSTYFALAGLFTASQIRLGSVYCLEVVDKVIIWAGALLVIGVLLFHHLVVVSSSLAVVPSSSTDGQE